VPHSAPSLNHRARGLIVDYALGAALVALLPIPYSFVVKIILLPVLMGLMVRGILRLWQGYTPDAVANLAAMDMALHYPDFQPNLHIYTYGTPRVGDLTFVENHSKLLPNHYRVVNLADMVPMTPLSNLLIVNFMHAGEQWSFLSHHGDIAPNHLIDVYRNAIGQQAEIPNNGQFVNLPLDLRQG
jgi:hypothetical protein